MGIDWGLVARRICRACVLLALAARLGGCSSEARAEEAVQDGVVAVFSQQPGQDGVVLRNSPAFAGEPASRLVRELLRQAVSLSLGSQTGLLRLDEALGEVISDEVSPAHVALHLNAHLKSNHLQVSLTRQQPDDEAALVLWSDSLGLKQLKKPTDAPQGRFNQQMGEQIGLTAIANYPEVLAAAERWSTTGIRQAIQEAGFRVVIADVTQSPASLPDIERSLNEMNFISQFTALRQSHQSIGTAAESTALTGALVRGYANLGLLTEHHWSPLSRAVRARSLIYAQQMVIKDPKSPIGYWHRAYAWALAGVHALAIEDLRLADERSKLASAEDLTQTEPPTWVPIIRLHCQFDDAGLQQIPQSSASSQLAGVLLIVQSLDPLVRTRSVELGHTVLKANPECYLLIDRLCDVRMLSNVRAMVQLAPAALDYGMRKRFAEARELPTETEQYLVQNKSKPLDVSVIVRSLRESDVAAPGSGGLSWPTLAHLIEQEHRVQIWRRLAFLKNMLNVPIDDMLPDALTVLLGGPSDRVLNYDPANGEAVLKVGQFDVVRRKRLLEQIQATDTKTLGPQKVPPKALLAVIANLIDSPVLDPRQRLSLRAASPEALLNLNTAGLRLARALDMNYSEIIAAAQSSTSRASREQLGHALLQISPQCPSAWAEIIRTNSKYAFAHQNRWAPAVGSRPQVLAAVARIKRKDSDPAVAIKALQDYISLSPDFWAYDELAKIYQKMDRLDLWRQTLDEFLEQPTDGLQQANVRAEIANKLMDQGDYQGALPYADTASESYAGVGMVAAIRCYTGLGRLEDAVLWFDRLNERYGHNHLDFLRWCQRHGRGEAERAYAAAEGEVNAMVAQSPPEQLYIPGLLMMAAGKLPEAEQVFSRAVEGNANPRSLCYNGMFLVLIAQELRHDESRDATLKKMVASSDPSQATSIELAQMLTAAVNENEGKLDVDQADRLLKSASREDQINLNYVVGRWLELHQQPGQAISHYHSVFDVAEARSYSVYGPCIAGLRRLDALPADAFTPKSKSVSE